jgi:hypothetical protein
MDEEALKEYAPIRESEIRGSRGGAGYLFKYVGQELDVLYAPLDDIFEPQQPHDPILQISDHNWAQCQLIYCPNDYEECHKNRHDHSEVGYKIEHCPTNIHLNGLYVVNRDKYLCHDFENLVVYNKKQPSFDYGDPETKVDIPVTPGPCIEHPWGEGDEGCYARPLSEDEEEEEKEEAEKEKQEELPNQRNREEGAIVDVPRQSRGSPGQQIGWGRQQPNPYLLMGVPAAHRNAILDANARRRLAYIEANPHPPLEPDQAAAVQHLLDAEANFPEPPRGGLPPHIREHRRTFLLANPIINNLLRGVFPEH